jgi:outer membrane protein OmpA-like peptidoglycan-associated protein
VAFATGLTCTLLAAVASAQSWRLHGTGAGAHAVSGHQKDELGFGAAALGAVEYAFVPEFGLALELGWAFLAEGDRPSDPRLEPIEGASAVSGALGLRARPFATHYDGTTTSAAGLWLAGGLGAANTNSLNRVFFDVHLGYDFLMQEGKLGVGPAVGLLYVNQPNDRVRPADANILLLGVHVMFDFADAVKAEPSDRDRDGLLDEVDKCPDNPEDKDGFEDDDGCPEDDNDKDGIVDAQDACPLVPEDKDGFEDGDGCPDDDNDKDGVVDSKDKCPDNPEDRDGFEDEDGCPEDDNDKDGVPDAKDLCPDEAETANGYADEDGCPDEQQVRVVGDRIVLDDRVHFRTNNHTIRTVSYPLLERLSKLVAEHPEYTHIAIEGHADLRGEPKFNKELSQRRAESVLEFMVEHGVARDRLSAEGFGSERPLVNDKTEHAYLLNRRVEFVVTRKVKQILGPDGRPIEPESNAPPLSGTPAAGPVEAPPAAPPATEGEAPSDLETEQPAAPEGEGE